MKRWNLALVAILVCALNCTGPTNGNNGPSPGPGPNSDCKVDYPSWSHEASGRTHEQTLDVLLKLEAVATAGQESLSKGEASLGVALSNLIKEVSHKEFSVSQDVTDQAVKLWRLECAILRGTFPTPEMRKEAEKMYLAIIADLRTIPHDQPGSFGSPSEREFQFLWSGRGPIAIPVSRNEHCYVASASGDWRDDNSGINDGRNHVHPCSSEIQNIKRVVDQLYYDIDQNSYQNNDAANCFFRIHCSKSG